MQPVSLTTLADEQLAAARESSRGRSTYTVPGDNNHMLRHVVLALVAGHGLPEHNNPGEATLQVLSGRVRLVAGSDRCEGRSGDHLVIPPERHDLTAIEDSVALLTLVPRR